MKAHELLRMIVRHGDQRALSRGLHVSTNLVSLWTRSREEGGQRNPVETVIAMFQILTRKRNPRAGEIVRYINEETGHLPPIPVHSTSTLAELSTLLKETSEALAVQAKADADQKRTVEELEELIREYGDVAAAAEAIRAQLRRERDQIATVTYGSRQLDVRFEIRGQ